MDACLGARRQISLRMPVSDANGHSTLQDRQLEVNIPKGIRPGQHLRLAGQGAPGQGGGAAGDLYLEIQVLPHAVFTLDGADISFDLPVTPWEAALGATVTAPTPDGAVQLSVPAGSSNGRKLRLKGRGLPGKVPGDLYALLSIALPPSGTAAEQEAYAAFARAFPRLPAPRCPGGLKAMTAITTRTLDVLVVEEELVFSLAALCQASGAQAWQVQALVVEGVLQPSGPRPEDWRFGGVALQRTRLALRLARDFELAGAWRGHRDGPAAGNRHAARAIAARLRPRRRAKCVVEQTQRTRRHTTEVN